MIVLVDRLYYWFRYSCYQTPISCTLILRHLSPSPFYYHYLKIPPSSIFRLPFSNQPTSQSISPSQFTRPRYLHALIPPSSPSSTSWTHPLNQAPEEPYELPSRYSYSLLFSYQRYISRYYLFCGLFSLILSRAIFCRRCGRKSDLRLYRCGHRTRVSEGTRRGEIRQTKLEAIWHWKKCGDKRHDNWRGRVVETKRKQGKGVGRGNIGICRGDGEGFYF